MVAAMGALAEYPAMVKSVFLNDHNDAGIYALRFYIRGKPWVVTVDDYVFTMDLAGKRRPLFGQMGKQNALWGMIIEKAWSKVKGTYTHIDGGFTQNGLRAVTGAPVFSYFSKDIKFNQQGILWEMVHLADEAGYLMSAGTDGDSDTKVNSCGINQAHAYSIISAFYLETTPGVADYKLYMLRNPWGETAYKGKFKHDDARWTEAYKAQVPHGIDPTTSNKDGIFFVHHEDMTTCVFDVEIAHYRDNEGYSDTWYDQEKDWGFENIYKAADLKKDGDLYITVESYYQSTVPLSCSLDTYPILLITAHLNSINDANPDGLAYYYDQFHRPILIEEANYKAGDDLIIVVQYDWKWYPEPDYTLKLYSK